MTQIKEVLAKLVEGKSLETHEAEAVLDEILAGSATDAQIGALLAALKAKGETPQELAGFAKALRRAAIRVEVEADRLVDTAGTGGDAVKTFNVSTAAAFVLAAGGLKVAKHGNRSVSSRSGSADLMEAFGVKLEVDPKTVAQCIRQANIGFMYAPAFHPALKRVSGIRRELGFRTVFNLLGPLVNPAGVRRQLLGVAEQRLVGVVAKALSELGAELCYVVHGTEGLDEVSICSPTLVAIVKDNTIEQKTLTPKDLGMEPAQPSQLVCSGVEESALTVYRILSGRLGADDPKTRIVAANAAAGFLVGGSVERVDEGVELALQTIRSGRPIENLHSLVRLSGGDLSRLERFETLV